MTGTGPSWGGCGWECPAPGLVGCPSLLGHTLQVPGGRGAPHKSLEWLWHRPGRLGPTASHGGRLSVPNLKSVGDGEGRGPKLPATPTSPTHSRATPAKEPHSGSAAPSLPLVGHFDLGDCDHVSPFLSGPNPPEVSPRAGCSLVTS